MSFCCFVPRCSQRLFVMAACVLGSLGMGKPLHAAVISTNGSFEDLGSNKTSKTASWKSYTGIPGWSTTDTGIEIWSNSFNNVKPYAGVRLAEINGTKPSTLYETLSGVAAGQSLNFQFAHRGRNGTDVMQFRLIDLGKDNKFGTADDKVLFSKDYSDANTAWGAYSNSGLSPIVTSGDTIRVEFTSVSTAGNKPSEGNLLDDVVISTAGYAPVPEPSVLAAVVAVGGMLMVRRRARV